MKATSSKSETKKRKRDGLQEPLTESPKRAKVHAQRKFAQGAAFSSSVITPVKDKVRPTASVSIPRPLLTNKCPNTEDFLTFLCFRRTSILPSKLDFFKDAFGSESESPAQAEKSSSGGSNCKSNSESSGKQNSKKNEKIEDSKKSQARTVQALRKKYQEQRLAKEKVTNVTKLAQKVKGKNMVRTRSSAIVEETSLTDKRPIFGERTRTMTSSLRSGLKRIQTIDQKFIKGKHLRSGLRSGGSVEKFSVKTSQISKTTTPVVKNTEKDKKKLKPEVSEIKPKNVKVKKTDGFSDFSSDDNEPLLAVKKLKTETRKSGNTSVERVTKPFPKTRSQNVELQAPQVSIRPTRKTKEAAAIYMEMITKKLVSPEKSGDDDVSSVDSFPELPNAKRNEQRETEIKAKALAGKKVEPKQTTEEKPKEIKKSPAKKTEAMSKTELKSSKPDVSKKVTPKKEGKETNNKQENVSSLGKRSRRRFVKEEEEEEKEKSVFSARPSTRSRPQEDVEITPKKSVTKKVSKTNTNKNEAKEVVEKDIQKGKKLKEVKEESSTFKNESVGLESEEVKAQKKGKEKEGKKKSVEEPKDVQEGVGTKKKKKFEVVHENTKRRTLREKKEKIEEKEEKESIKTDRRKKEKGVSEVVDSSNKRPIRKCSTVDKIWIDIDGFTSDEEDFLDVGSTTRTRATNRTSKTEKETTKSNIETNVSGNKSKAKDSDKKEESKTRKSNAKVEETSSRKSSQSGKVPGNSATLQTQKSDDDNKTGPQSTEKREKNSGNRKETKSEQEKAKDISDVKTHAVESTVKGKNVSGGRRTTEVGENSKESTTPFQAKEPENKRERHKNIEEKDLKSEKNKNIEETVKKSDESVKEQKAKTKKFKEGEAKEQRPKFKKSREAEEDKDEEEEEEPKEKNTKGKKSKEEEEPKEVITKNKKLKEVKDTKEMNTKTKKSKSDAKEADQKMKKSKEDEDSKEVNTGVKKLKEDDVTNELSSRTKKSKEDDAKEQNIKTKKSEDEESVKEQNTKTRKSKEEEYPKEQNSKTKKGKEEDDQKEQNTKNKKSKEEDSKEQNAKNKKAKEEGTTKNEKFENTKAKKPKEGDTTEKSTSTKKTKEDENVKKAKEEENSKKATEDESNKKMKEENNKKTNEDENTKRTKDDNIKDQNTKSKKTKTVEEKKETKVDKPMKRQKRMSKKEKITKSEDVELESNRRKRPVRQCSTGEKRWIETDSDSFSFYETSDDEDNLPIVDFSGKNKAKPSPKEAKETKAEPEKMEKKEDDNFSESDEEPLKKKACHAVEPEKKDIGEQTPGRVQREMPGLHPLKKSTNETYNSRNASTSETSQEPVNVFVPDPKIIIHHEKPELPRHTLGNENQNFMVHLNPPGLSVPNRIEMILHSLKRDKMMEETRVCSSTPIQTFASPPYLPIPQPIQVQINQVPCSYQINTINFPTPREPISTHGLDLLSEVALPTTPKEKISSQTERIEKWLNDSLAADQKKRFTSFSDVEYKERKSGESTNKIFDKTQPEPGYYLEKPELPSSSKPSQPEVHKFGQMELAESQKLLKKNLMAAEREHKNEASKLEHQTPKKTLTSVQDLLKLQKERKDLVKTPTENLPHLKNCKCNNCIVKKGWFKNKPVPKSDQQKLSPVEDGQELTPFESLTKAFTKNMSGEEKNLKMSVSVAPMVVHPSYSPVKDAASSSSTKDGNEKRGIFQQRKLSFLERMKERERKEAAAKLSSNAFSPNNESSVYAFEPEPEQAPKTSTPFRSKTRESRTSSRSTSKSDEEGWKICEDEKSQVVSSGTQVEKTSSTGKSSNNKASQSASIAVQVNLDSEAAPEAEATPEVQDGKSIEISTQTEVPEEDSDSPMFYIPLQQGRAAGTSVSSDQQMIQGVALKLGTEGPMGPNQRVIMKAQLLTKPPDTPSMKAVVMPQPKRIFDQKNNNPPIGTVQPTTRKPPEVSPEPKIADTESTNSPPQSFNRKVDTSDTNRHLSANSANHSDTKTEKSSSGTVTGKASSKSKEKNPQTASKEKSDLSEENSPSSSGSSSKSKRGTKQKCTEPIGASSSSSSISSAGTSSTLVEAPTFYPTEKEFQDPFEFFDRIRPAAEKFGLCRIIPPSNFKPDCKVTDDMRFTAYNQYVHRMFHRWGPNIKEMMAIKKYLITQSISLKQPPLIGGIEVDLPRLYQSVQNCGGLMKVMEKKKWHQVADLMKIPRAAQDRVTKLDDIYCKYLLPYDTLSPDERQNLFDEVEKDWKERQERSVEPQGEEETEEENYIEECEECVVKGRTIALNQFYRVARNNKSMWFKNSDPLPREVENEFWKHVRERNHHVCVHSGSIDSSGWGYGFPIGRNNSFSKHPWNLKVLTNNCGSVLRSLGPVMGVTVPTLHVGMVFTAFCWYRDPHGLPWIDYLHTGAPKIWYGISDDNSTVFREALAKLLPRYIKNKTIWLPSDTAMVPPDLLVENGVNLCHIVQEPGQFILVFPRAFTSSICTGYLVSESVYFAQPSWLTTAEQVFKDIQESCEPSVFSLEKLLFNIALDTRSSVDVLKQVLPMVWHVRQKEIDGRKTLFNLGLKASERMPLKELGSKKKKARWAQEEEGDYECEICRMNLYVSLVTNSQEEAVYCLPHAIDLLTRKRNQLKFCKILYTYTQEEMNELVEKLEQRIENKSQKKLQNKSSSSTK